MQFTFEKLHVYQKAQHLFEKTSHLSDRIKDRTPYSIIDQLTRASLSIPLNIAEGNGRWHKKEKKQFFYIARGSLLEVIAILQAIFNRGQLSAYEYEEFRKDLTVIAKMLTALIHSLERSAQSGRSTQNSLPV